MLASLSRQRERPRLEARRAAASGPAVSDAVRASAAQRIQLAFLDLPGAPLRLISGAAEVSGASASSPRIQVENRSRKVVRYFELGWLVSDAAGTRYAAGSVPGPTADLHLAPGETLATSRQRRFSFSPKGAGARAAGFAIDGMSGYVKQVVFEDGKIWVPSRDALARASLTDTIPVSAEEQRLADLYRTKGLKAVIAELEKF